MRLSAAALLVIAAFTTVATCVEPQQTSQPSSQTPTQQSPAPAQTKPKKKPEEPIDPDTSAGVRGSGAIHTVRVLRKGKLVEAAHVMVKNANGSIAASCYTDASGECQVEIGADTYVIEASQKAYAGNVSRAIDDSTGVIVIKLLKLQVDSNSKP